jgi:broad specificity phosphatase PhoE
VSSAAPRLIVMTRHAESVANAAHDVSSDPAKAIPLTTLGREQAQRLGEQIGSLDVDVAVCTRFLRTRQTAEIALAGRDVPIVVDPLFDEVDAGDLDGAPIEAYWAWKHSHPPTERFPHGESIAEALRRYANALRGLAARIEPVTLVVAHEFALRHIVEAATGSAPDIANATPYLFGQPALLRAATGLDAWAMLHA